MKRLLSAIAVVVALGAVRAVAEGPPILRKPQAVPNYQPKKEDLVVLYEHDEFKGKAVGLPGDTLDLVPVGFNDQASSIKLRYGYQATFFEDTGGKGEWFTLNCPLPAIGIQQGEFCELKSVGSDIATGALCAFRGQGAPGCVPWWNDRISGVGRIGPADPHQPQGRIDQGHAG